MGMKKYLRGLIAVPVVATVLLTGMQFSQARENPFSDVQIVQLSDEAKAAYINEKTFKSLL